jgi:hypothetical protein
MMPPAVSAAASFGYKYHLPRIAGPGKARTSSSRKCRWVRHKAESTHPKGTRCLPRGAAIPRQGPMAPEGCGTPAGGNVPRWVPAMPRQGPMSPEGARQCHGRRLWLQMGSGNAPAVSNVPRGARQCPGRGQWPPRVSGNAPAGGVSGLAAGGGYATQENRGRQAGPGTSGAGSGGGLPS